MVEPLIIRSRQASIARTQISAQHQFMQRNSIEILPGLGRCPHCGVAAPLLVQIWRGTPPSAHSEPQVWGCYYCSRCGGLITAKTSSEYNLVNGYIDEVYPAAPAAHEDIPDVARRFLQQAMDTIHAPDAAAVMAGAAVDAMLKKLGYEDGSVYSRIDKALEQNKLTLGMAEWAHAVRLGSNRPRHADKDNPHVSPDEAKQSVQFAEALGTFLFVLSAKIERGIAAADAA
jgi:hypothetical protein